VKQDAWLKLIILDDFGRMVPFYVLLYIALYSGCLSCGTIFVCIWLLNVHVIVARFPKWSCCCIFISFMQLYSSYVMYNVTLLHYTLHKGIIDFISLLNFNPYKIMVFCFKFASIWYQTVNVTAKCFFKLLPWSTILTLCFFILILGRTFL